MIQATSYQSDESRWRAVLEHDMRAYGAFVYAVRSTGIYCRPVCPARRPKRENVSFFPSAAGAARSGYRPCRRCQPDRESPARTRVLEICRRIEAAPDAPPRLAELAAHIGLSPTHLQRSFKRVLGVSPREYADALRAGRLRADLRRGLDVARATYAAGYGSSSRVYERARQRLGMTPGRYRRGGEGERIRWVAAECALGWLLVAASESGICRVALGASASQLEAELRRELPRAELVRDGATLAPWLAALLEYAERGLPLPDLPLDVQATAFQCRVWQALRDIPHGETRSYAEVARAAGRPGATRAAASACARNPAALVIPCHRALRGDGEPGGYRWGVRRKRALLRLEASTPGVTSGVPQASRKSSSADESTHRRDGGQRPRRGLPVV